MPRATNICSRFLAGLLASTAAIGCVFPTSEPTFGEMWTRRLPEIMATTSEFQSQILEDARVTPEEHELAQRTYLSCITDADVEILRLERDRYGNIRNLELRAPDPAKPSIVMDRCNSEYYVHVGQGWRAGLHPNDTESAQLVRIAECMTRSGYAVPARPTNFGELLEAAEELGGSAKAQLVSCNESEQFN